ncbi:MAG: UDP-N-acetylmuramoyl-tripeptide--D-alanyl-D-alanine ligase [Chthoniobacterales bacterium]
MDPKSIFSISELAGGRLRGDGNGMVTAVTTDSRTIHRGELFVALRGEKFDGHDFLRSAQQSGAEAAIVERVDPALPELPQIEVADCLAALQRLAKGYRDELSLKVVGITGSNGKTSTKEMVTAVLGERFRVVKTEGNLNNHIGVPLSILRASSKHEVAVLEVGMNHAGELKPLVEMARPDVAVITNIGIAHIEFLESREAIAREKAVLAEAVPREGVVILNANDSFTAWIATRCQARIVRAGLETGDVQARDIVHYQDGEAFTIADESGRTQAKLPVLGEHMVLNATMAVAVGRALGLSLEECVSGLRRTSIPGGRMRFQRLGALFLLNDAYNANPDSVVAALKTASCLPLPGRRVAALGRMGELGQESAPGHLRVGSAAAEFGFEFLVTVGQEGKLIAEAAASSGLKDVVAVTTHEEAVDVLNQHLQSGDILLVKGSFASRMDRVIDGLERTGNQAKWRGP